MAGGMSIRGLEDLKKNLMDSDVLISDFCEDCAKELAARLLALAIKRTPVGVYPKGSGRTGGTLRRGWTAQQSGSGSEGFKTRGAREYVDTLRIHHFGDTYVVEIANPTEYASYVEFGHRTRNHKGWVKGRFMLTLSEKEIQRAAPAILEKKINKFLKGVFG